MIFFSYFLKKLKRKITNEKKVFLGILDEETNQIIAKTYIDLSTLKGQSTIKRVYWMKDEKGMIICGLTIKLLFIENEVIFNKNLK